MKPKPSTVQTETSGGSMRPKPVTRHDSAQPETILVHEVIAERAFSFWEARGFAGGTPEEDWFRAIDELTREVTSNSQDATPKRHRRAAGTA